MAPKIVRPVCKSSKGIVIMRRLLNNLHRHRASLNTSIFFEEGIVHSLGSAWTSRVPIGLPSTHILLRLAFPPPNGQLFVEVFL
ncbi:hypothetical protein ACFX2I_031115 [Malus domestica]